MKRPSSNLLRRRIVLFAGLLAFALVLVSVNVAVVIQVRGRASQVPTTAPLAVRQALAQCARDPATWRSVRMRRLRVDAFDATSWAPADAAGEPLDSELRKRLEAGEQAPITGGTFWGVGTRVAWRAAGGPCGIVQAEFGPSRKTAGYVGSTFAAAFLLAGLAVLAAYAAILRPLRVRVRRLRRSAEKLGEAAGRGPEEDLEDLDAIANAIEVGIESQGEANAQLSLRAERLERHLAELAHDLRTPLAALQLAIERMVEDVPAEERHKLAGRALVEHMYVTTLLENLETATTVATDLPSAKSESDVDLNLVLRAVVARFSLLAEQRNIELASSHPDEPTIVRAVSTLLERGVGNLVHNAIRHGRAGGHVAVLLIRSGSQFTLTVEDDGPGMTDELLRSLEGGHAAAPHGVPRADGTLGIGLTVVKLALERAHMTIVYETGGSGGLLVTVRGAVSESSGRS